MNMTDGVKKALSDLATTVDNCHSTDDDAELRSKIERERYAPKPVIAQSVTAYTVTANNAREDIEESRRTFKMLTSNDTRARCVAEVISRMTYLELVEHADAVFEAAATGDKIDKATFPAALARWARKVQSG